MVKKSNKPTFEFAMLKPNERLREMILYITERHLDDSTFGATKLNKILFFADFLSYFETGLPVTGVAYRKDEFGPVPADIEKILKQMETSDEIAKRFFGGGWFKKTIYRPKRKADLAAFTKDQIAQVDAAIKMLAGKTAEDASDLSHKRFWRIARLGELIPYEFAFLSDNPLTAYDINRTKELCSKYGWQN